MVSIFLRTIDTVSEYAGKLAAWGIVLIGFFITYEVFMRYVFVAPTIWVDEVSTLIQVWAVYFAASYALKHHSLIVIDVAFRDPETLARRCVDTISLSVIFAFSAVVVSFGFNTWLETVAKGHATDSFLAIPKWITTMSVWLGFSLILAQAIAEIIKVWTIDRAQLDSPESGL